MVTGVHSVLRIRTSNISLKIAKIVLKSLYIDVDMLLLHLCITGYGLHSPIRSFGHLFGPGHFCFINFEASPELNLTLGHLVKKAAKFKPLFGEMSESFFLVQFNLRLVAKNHHDCR